MAQAKRHRRLPGKGLSILSQRLTVIVLTAMISLGLVQLLSARQSVASPQPASEIVSVGLERADVVDLGGRWFFQEDPNDAGEEAQWYSPGRVRKRTCQTPLPWQLAFFEDLHEYIGAAWYERTVQLPGDWTGKRIVIASHGLANEAKIWVNGHFAGEAVDVQQTPFVMNVTPWAKPGLINTITIKATDPPGGMLGSWTANRASGLIHDIWVEATAPTFIADIHMKPDVDKSHVRAQVTISAAPRKSSGSCLLIMEVRAEDEVAAEVSQRFALPAGDTRAHLVREITVSLSNLKLWDIEQPNLYHVKASLLSDRGTLWDCAATTFGMRKLEARGKRIYLNGKPLYLLGGGLDPGPYGGALDVNYHLPPPYQPLADSDQRRIVEQIKSLGVNFARCTLRPAPPWFLKWADRLGLLVWSEWPWYRDSPVDDQGHVSESLKRKWTAVALRDRNHPSLALWGMFNEGLPVPNPEPFVEEMYDILNQLNPACFKLDSSGGRALSGLNYAENHLKSDLDDVHWYPSFFHFDHVRELIGGQRSYGKPLIVTEFGPIPYIHNIPKIRKVWNDRLPWWARQQASNYAAYGDLADTEKRFQRWNLDQVWGDYVSFSQASDRYYGLGLKHQIELVRMNPEMCGLLPWIYESTPHPTGWVDYFWEKKIFVDDLAKLMTQDLIVLDMQGRRNFWSTETVRVNVHMSHFGDNDSLVGSIRWWVEGTDIAGSLGSISVDPGDVRQVGQISFRAPVLEKAAAYRLFAAVEQGDTTATKNYVDFYVYPFSYRKPTVDRAAVHATLGWRFQILGYKQSGVLVTTRMDETAEKALQAGNTVLLLVCPDLVPGFPHLIRRELDPTVLPFLHRYGLDLGSREQGAHSDTYFIKRTGDLFARIPLQNPLGWPFRTVWPQHVILGFTVEHQADILAGAFGMMITSRAHNSQGVPTQGEVTATIAQCRVGQGRLLLSTFDLLNPFLDDPVATIMLNDLIAYASSEFDPVFRLGTSNF